MTGAPLVAAGAGQRRRAAPLPPRRDRAIIAVAMLAFSPLSLAASAQPQGAMAKARASILAGLAGDALALGGQYEYDAKVIADQARQLARLLLAARFTEPRQQQRPGGAVK